MTIEVYHNDVLLRGRVVARLDWDKTVSVTEQGTVRDEFSSDVQGAAFERGYDRGYDDGKDDAYDDARQDAREAVIADIAAALENADLKKKALKKISAILDAL